MDVKLMERCIRASDLELYEMIQESRARRFTMRIRAKVIAKELGITPARLSTLERHGCQGAQLTARYVHLINERWDKFNGTKISG